MPALPMRLVYSLRSADEVIHKGVDAVFTVPARAEGPRPLAPRFRVGYRGRGPGGDPPVR
jgi:hypothetical protein